MGDLLKKGILAAIIAKFISSVPKGSSSEEKKKMDADKNLKNLTKDFDKSYKELNKYLNKRYGKEYMKQIEDEAKEKFEKRWQKNKREN